MGDSKDYTVFIRNFDSKQVTHDLLLELFTQAGPVQDLKLKEDFAFVEFEDQESVIYSCNLLNDTLLFGIPLQVKPRNGSIWEKIELIQFPSQTTESFNNSNNNNNNGNFNEGDFRANRSFSESSGVYSEPELRSICLSRHQYSDQHDFRQPNTHSHGNNNNNRPSNRNSFPQQHASPDYRSVATHRDYQQHQYEYQQQHHQEYQQEYQQHYDYQEEYPPHHERHVYMQQHHQQQNNNYYGNNASNNTRPVRQARASQMAQQQQQQYQHQHHQYPQQQQHQRVSRARDRPY